MDIRTGFGYDIHQLKEGYDLWLGGKKIDHSKGSVGHSDADVLIHSICDALLGAANKRDIGYHFPDTDPQYKGADSKKLLAGVVDILKKEGWSISNIDSTIVAEKPKINPHIPDMKEILSGILGIGDDRISIKATTSEKMSFVGKEKGIKAYATVLILKD